MWNEDPLATTAPFAPPAWLRGGHRQTILGHGLRRLLRWPLPAEDWPIDIGKDVRLLLRATWQPKEESPALVIVHGLGGSDVSSYALSLGRLAFADGWHVVRMNMRGCGGEGSCPLPYNAGLDSDLLAVVAAVARRASRIAVVGFSLGANLALLMAGRRRDILPPELRALAAISPPLDLARCAEALERPENRLYQYRFLRELTRDYRARERRRPDLFPAGRERGVRTIREFDERITAPLGGYRGAADYYALSSAGPWLVAIERPSLVLTADDDPLVPVETVARWPLSPAVCREITGTGGHVGFVSSSRAPGWFWAAERVLDFVERATVAGLDPRAARDTGAVPASEPV